MTDRIEVYEERPAEAWDAFVRTAPGGSFCHLSGWVGVMEEALGHRYHGLVARSASPTGDIVGVLPLVEMRSMLFGRHLISMPFLNYGGSLGSDHARTALVGRGIELAKRRRSESVQLRSRPPVPSSVEAAGPLNSDREKVTVLLDLPHDAETLWTNLKGKVRSQVRRPRKDGMTARVGQDQRDAFYTVFAHNMRDLGTPVLPRPFFDRLEQAFGDDVMFAAVYSEGVPVAGSCGFVFGNEYEMTWASSLREYNRSAPNMLLYWACMEEAIERGLEAFNFGRCTPGQGTHRFKLQWGGSDESLHWKRWTTVPTVDDGSGETGGLYQKAIGVWQRLPLPIANRLGPIVSRRIPWF